MSASAIKPPGGEPAESWNGLGIFVACDGTARGRKVCALLDQVGSIAAWWSFEALGSAHLRQLAASEAARADLVILAAQEGPGLPEAVIDWMSHWLGMKECCPRALMALLDADRVGNQTSGRVLAQLKGVAELGGLDFFARGIDGELETALISGVGAVVRRKRAAHSGPAAAGQTEEHEDNQEDEGDNPGAGNQSAAGGEFKPSR